MLEIDNLLKLAAEHWHLAVAAMVFMMIGQVVKTHLFTRERAAKRGKWRWAWNLGRATLPLQPVAAGMLLAAATSDSAYIGSGVVSVYLYDVLKSAAKKRGIILGLPGLETVK